MCCTRRPWPATHTPGRRAARPDDGICPAALGRWPGIPHQPGIRPNPHLPGPGLAHRGTPAAELALEPAHALRTRLLTLGLLAALAFSLVALWLARSFSRPIEQLANAARQIEQGASNARFPTDHRLIEVQQLSQSIQSMTTALLAHERELAAVNQTLETQVQQRTEALETANLNSNGWPPAIRSPACTTGGTSMPSFSNASRPASAPARVCRAAARRRPFQAGQRHPRPPLRGRRLATTGAPAE